MSYTYTNTMPLPKAPRTGAKRSLAKKKAHIAKIEERMKQEAAVRIALMRELRVLRRVRFKLSDQTESVRKSLELINYQPPG